MSLASRRQLDLSGVMGSDDDDVWRMYNAVDRF